MSRTTVMTVSYDGSPFAGFAAQPGQPTVQGRLEDALATALRRPVTLTCAGRTDAGVHALGQVVSFPAEETDPPPSAVLRSVNALAGPEVAVTGVAAAPAGFSARHDAVAREYRYRLVPGPVPPLFLRDVAWWVKGSLDVGGMREGAEALLGEHDFASFCVTETAARANAAEGMGTRRSIELLEVEPCTDLGEHAVVVRVVGRSFLHSMVRVIVGSLVEVGRGRRRPGWVEEALRARRRDVAGPTAPAHGLTLWHVSYPEELWL
jgi:tRNA pseudouridine38-40 synthase